MTQHEHKIDAHAKPPDELKAFYKKYQKLKAKELEDDDQLVDFSGGNESTRINRLNELKVVKSIDYSRESTKCPQELKDVGQDDDLIREFLRPSNDLETVHVYEHPDMPGLHIIPSLIPERLQTILLDRLVHRDVSDPIHQSNLHLHYDMQYPPGNASFFALDPSSDFMQQPKDTSVHKPINIQHMLNKKLRWITLGGQYDWTNKVYPSKEPPAFPPDIAKLLHFLFPDMSSQAAIVNFYSPGDTLSLHRDVAEECDRGLVSISFGCEGIFVLGLEDEDGKGCKKLALRLKSGDAVFMTGASRYAWHGVPQIVSGTCPGYLRDWPVINAAHGEDKTYEHWKGWMANKRINLNVRQMRE